MLGEAKAMDAVRRWVECERWLIARLVLDQLERRGEVTSAAVVDQWEALDVIWTRRRDAFTRVREELGLMVESGHLRRSELRPTHGKQGIAHQVYLPASGEVLDG